MFLALATCAVLHAHSNSFPVIEFSVQNKGTFQVELNTDEAPRTSAHILKMVEEKFFDGMLFHRRVSGFVLQGGDPDSKTWTREEARLKPGEMGGTEGLGESTYGQPIPFEKNNLSHLKGTIGIALESPGDDSGDSQFFINLADNKRLDGKYVCFGKVTKGMGVVMKTVRGDLIVSVTKLPETH